MDSINKTNQKYQQTNNWEEQTFEKEFDFFKEQHPRWRHEKNKIQIKITSDQKIIYSQNGEILRVVECHDALEKQELFNNIDQIHYLSWQGQYGENKKKDGKWIAFWNKNLIKDVDGQKGQKQGLWKDLFLNYENNIQIFETGEYFNSLKIGKWNYIYYDKMIGGGSYNKDGQKQGKWIEIVEGFYDSENLTCFGEYNMSGMKVGLWDIMYCDPFGDGKNKYIGGGFYDQEGYQKKIGKWVELFEEFYYCAQVTYNGEYNMNGMKVGRWDIMFDRYRCGEYKQIGGGSYAQEGNQKKIGKWVELDEGFYYDGEEKKLVTYQVEYNMNGMKVGRWDIMYDRYCDGDKNQIVGGSYDLEGNQIKIGKWVELDEGFYCGKYSSNEYAYNGEYNFNGMKVGRWDVMNLECRNFICGCINFDENGNEIYRSQNESINFIGSFRNSRKVGRWDFIYRKYREREFNKIGGGSYDQEGNQIKIGMWVELGERFSHFNEVTYNGEYNMKGQKVGVWVEMDIMENKKRGEKRQNKQ